GATSPAGRPVMADSNASPHLVSGPESSLDFDETRLQQSSSPGSEASSSDKMKMLPITIRAAMTVAVIANGERYIFRLSSTASGISPAPPWLPWIRQGRRNTIL